MHAGTLFTATLFFTEQNGKSHEQGQVTHRPSAKHSSSRVSPLRMVTKDSLPLSGGGNNSRGFLCLIEFATEQNRKDSDFVQTKKLRWHSILAKTYLTIWTCVCVCVYLHTDFNLFSHIYFTYISHILIYSYLNRFHSQQEAWVALQIHYLGAASRFIKVTIQTTSSNSEVQTVFKIISFLMKALSSLTVNSFIFHILIILGHV